MEGPWGGRTLGKSLAGFWMARVDGSPIDLRQAVVRGALGLIEVWATLGGLEFLAIFASERDQHIGDIAVWTLVLSETRGRTRGFSAVWFLVPPGCSNWCRPWTSGP